MKDITKERKKQIEEVVQKLISNYDFSKSPSVDIVSFVKKNGFTVRRADMDMGTTGWLWVNDNEKEKERLIVVNKFFKNPDHETDVVYKKSRFITAHEYGHYVLHKPESKPLYAHRDTEHREDQEELEADYFARAILMPYEAFKMCYEFIQEMNKNDVEFTEAMLSKLFGVTRKKVRLRISDLEQLGK